MSKRTSQRGEKEPRNKKKRRECRRSENLTAFYEGLTIASYPSATDPPAPGTPHNLFSKCYRLQNGQGIKLRAHQHVNGLVVVALDPESLPNEESSSPLVAVDYKIEPIASEVSTAQKRKQNDLLLRGSIPSPGPGLVKPTDVLVSLTRENGANLDVPCCVLGTVLEINPRLTVDLLQKDPLLEGYLAIFLPAGNFPPESLLGTSDGTE